MRVKNPNDTGYTPYMTLYYDYLIAEHLYEIEDPGYMKYHELENYLVDNGYEDALDSVRGNKVKLYY